LAERHGRDISRMIPLEKLLELEARGAASAPAALACFDFESLVCIYADESYAALASVDAHDLVGRPMSDIVGRGTLERTQSKQSARFDTHKLRARATAAVDFSMCRWFLCRRAAAKRPISSTRS
jgi:hypothetical protein